jgi:cyclopropane-fatty-acyl-phospholipid synthase
MGLVDSLSSMTEGAHAEALRRGVARLAAAGLQAGGLPLAIVLPDGSRIETGTPARIVLRIRDVALLAELASPTLGALGDAYVAGRLEIEGDLLEALPVGVQLVESAGATTAQRGLQAWLHHRRAQDRAAIGHHYDVGNAFYALWLDRGMVYSCAYYRTGAESIDVAQEAKLDHVCRKLRLTPGERLLDVGCGWGGLVQHAVQHYGARAVGITLSESQASYARERLRRAGLDDRAEVLLLDYRDLPKRFAAGSFDKAASIGMFEHVGLRNLSMYFATVASVLRDRDLFLNHGITSSDVESRPVGSGVSDFIGRHVFPHGELPHLHVATREMSAAGFEIADVESLRPHYARTLATWYRRLEACSAEAARLVSAETLRTWRIYLAGCAYGFEQGWVNIYQLLGSVDRTPGPTALPLTRDWIYAQ